MKAPLESPESATVWLQPIIIVQEFVVSFNPQVLVLDARENTSLIKDFLITYSISSTAALTNGGSFGTVTIDEHIDQQVVKYFIPNNKYYDYPFLSVL